MKTPGRRRVATGWTLLLLGLLVAGVWAASQRWWIVWMHGNPKAAFIYRTWLAPGTVSINRFPSFPQPYSSLESGRVNEDARPLHSWYRAMSEDELKLWFFQNASVYDLWVVAYVQRGQQTVIKVLLWPIPLLLWTPATLLLRSGYLAQRRAKTNACAKCGYSLAGLAAEVPCPECGKGARTT
jgi:hypothetical protein